MPVRAGQQARGQQTEDMAQTLFALTLRLAFRIAIVWAGGFILAVAVRALLPDQIGLTFGNPRSTILLPYSRIGFWVCLLAALTVSAMIVIRSMLVDLGWVPRR
jgi:hypothetical protein